MNNNLSKSKFYKDIAELLDKARQKTYTTINTIMVETYWKIGQKIVLEEQKGNERANYGEKLIENLSIYLTDKFGKGFSEANLKNMRRFYIVCPKLDTHCVTNLSWSNVRQIIRLDNKEEREYYFNESYTQKWSSRELERNIKTKYYYRLLSTKNKTNNKDNLPIKKTLNNIKIENFIKDPYILEFLDINEDIEGKETILEKALINNLQKFLLELGKGFSFIGRQYRISTETEHFYIDLVFYNYLLKCFVIIDLKTRKLNHSDIGQMDMYVRMFDKLKKQKDDNPTIGIKND